MRATWAYKILDACPGRGFEIREMPGNPIMADHRFQREAKRKRRIAPRMGPVEALKATYSEVKESFTPSDGVGVLILVLLIGTGLLSGILFAIQDFGHTNPVISFLAGCVTGPLFVALSYGSLFGGAFLVAFVFRVAGARRADGFFGMLLLFSFMGLLFFSGIYAASHIPIVNKQIAYLLRHLDDE